ncbi:hypothetical protein PI95_020645 [Hassallia byssoidea VB512170]|uniref:Uncharacterized protein n=1 Tax=Hassallia byssoidea VB512170 TaxID=1304833 RepID=A0A846HBC1_9CYAN|nr:hypothetical protein [Hassalia byssoidea VB512170]
MHPRKMAREWGRGAGRQGDKGTRGQGDKGTRGASALRRQRGHVRYPHERLPSGFPR